MDGMTSLWCYQESIDDLKHRLFCANLELESTRACAQEEIRKNEENVQQLLQLLELIIQERDEARYQLQKLLHKIIGPSEQIIPAPQHRGNSSITEADTINGNHHQPFNSSSTLESFFRMISSPGLPSIINMAGSSITATIQQPFLSEHDISMASICTSSSGLITKFDPASMVIDRLIAKKPLPEKGKLFQAVMETGPLQQNLLMAGPLPRWQNPPPLLKHLQLPPVSTKVCESETPILNPIMSFPKHGVPQICSASSPLDFWPVCVMKKRTLLSICASGYQVPPTSKRQKPQ